MRSTQTAPLDAARPARAGGTDGPCVLAIVGGAESHCPWGEPGGEVLRQSLGFDEPARWMDAVAHLASKVSWAEEGMLAFEVVPTEGDFAARALALAAASSAILVLLVDVPPKLASEALARLQGDARCGGKIRGVLELSPPSKDSEHSIQSWLSARADETSQQSATEIVDRCLEFWNRATAEDALYAILFAAQFSLAPVRFVARQPGVDTLEKVTTLCTKCLRKALDAAVDPAARACLACQSECDVRDQTRMYRCTVSYESDALAGLVRCFERKGIFDCGAEVPRLPDFEPLRRFRGQDLSLQAAWLIMEGHWWSSQGCSWRPVLGQNPAYDYFPCQFNSWYRDPRGDRGWYDPVFKVVTLDGAEVWRKRHYRVQPGASPGAFWLSTEDNGISLKEHWRIVDADDNLQWAVLHYAGAAAAVGQSYSGSLLVTADGQPPNDAPVQRIREAFYRSGVAPFELYGISQGECRAGSCGAPPLTDFASLARYRDQAAVDA